MNKDKSLPLVLVSDFQLVNINEEIRTVLKALNRDIYIFVLYSPLKSTANSFLPLPLIINGLSRYKNNEHLRTVIPIKLTRDFDFLYSIINSLSTFGISECDIVVDAKYLTGSFNSNGYKGFNINYDKTYFSEFENGIHINSQDYRRGLKDAIDNRYPATVPCVDVVIQNEDGTKLLVARKHEESLWRFIGGHVDVTDDSYEEAARREFFEETDNSILPENIIGKLKYLGSFKVADWRYKFEPKDGIMTAVYLITVKEVGDEKGGDDIAEVKWINVEDLKNSILVTEHKKILNLYLNAK